jgi:ABC-type sulfate/molybdate transport systems ATPase subunit
MLRVRARKRLRDFDLDIALDVPPGITLVAGPNGAGKTTLLRLIAGLVQPDSGSIVLDDRVLAQPPGIDVPPGQRNIALLFQEHALFPHLTVAQNVVYGLEARRVPRAQRDDAVAAMLERLELGHLAAERPKELSGGQRQRAALARALVLEPKAILLDEPFASLDLQTKIAVRREIARVLAELRVPALLVTHDPADAAIFAQRLAVLEAGRLSALGTLDELAKTAKGAFVRDFIGQVPAVAPQPTRP